MFTIGSTSPAALMYDALDHFDRRSTKLLVLILASYNCLSFVLTYLILFQRSQTAIARSRSEPVDTQVKTIKMDTFFRIIPSTPENDGDNSEDGEDIAEEEAVCRICLIELGEGGSKGEGKEAPDGDAEETSSAI
ncbi:RING/U-box superfamily protein [Trifolium repens]|nr:RING/U-box superfamily protein [Trifolium repens]